jgi:hypothetical protein
VLLVYLQISISIFKCLAMKGHDAPEVFLSPVPCSAFLCLLPTGDPGGCLAVLTALEFRCVILSSAS